MFFTHRSVCHPDGTRQTRAELPSRGGSHFRPPLARRLGVQKNSGGPYTTKIGRGQEDVQVVSTTTEAPPPPAMDVASAHARSLRAM